MTPRHRSRLVRRQGPSSHPHQSRGRRTQHRPTARRRRRDRRLHAPPWSCSTTPVRPSPRWCAHSRRTLAGRLRSLPLRRGALPSGSRDLRRSGALTFEELLMAQRPCRPSPQLERLSLGIEVIRAGIDRVEELAVFREQNRFRSGIGLDVDHQSVGIDRQRLGAVAMSRGPAAHARYDAGGCSSPGKIPGCRRGLSAADGSGGRQGSP